VRHVNLVVKAISVETRLRKCDNKSRFKCVFTGIDLKMIPKSEKNMIKAASPIYAVKRLTRAEVASEECAQALIYWKASAGQPSFGSANKCPMPND
jgi:hypothetical protein